MTGEGSRLARDPAPRPTGLPPTRSRVTFGYSRLVVGQRARVPVKLLSPEVGAVRAMRSHILLVEDEEHLGVGIKYNLEAEGYRVTLVGDGPTALKLVASDAGGIGLIILDLMLPGMSGYQVCEAIRRWGVESPVLMLSSRTLSEDRTRGFDVGANQYLSKPFELDELLSRVKNLLGHGRRNGSPASPPRTPPPERVQRTAFGRVQVDFETHQVFVEGRGLRMTSKELRLLRYFVENPDRVISRQELLAEVWQRPGNVQTRSVDQFIVRLRKALEEDPSQPRHLLTIREAGYRFIADPEFTADPEATPQNSPEEQTEEAGRDVQFSGESDDRAPGAPHA